MLIAISGNMGVGKTTLGRKLAPYINAQFWEEPFEANPFLKDFYLCKTRWALPIQLRFLLDFYNRDIVASRVIPLTQQHALIDRSTAECSIFAQALYNLGFISPREYQLYTEIFNHFITDQLIPDLHIYIRATPEQILDNVKLRGRPCEYNISLEYVKALNEHYEHWMEWRSVIAVDVAEVLNTDNDFLERLAINVAAMLGYDTFGLQ